MWENRISKGQTSKTLECRENYIHYHCQHLDGFDFEHLTEAELRGGAYRARLDSPDYLKAPQAAYLQLALDESSIQAVSLEDVHRQNNLSLLDKFQSTRIIFGAVTIAKSHVESIEESRARLSATLEHIDQDRLIAAPDCGLGLLGWELSLKKLRNLCQAAASI